jgi:hypothetical protein
VKMLFEFRCGHFAPRDVKSPRQIPRTRRECKTKLCPACRRAPIPRIVVDRPTDPR